jgi:hypothetical protein
MRLMLVEFFRGALRRNERSMLFPFLKGLAQERGFEALWLCYGGDLAHKDGATPGRTLFASLPGEDLQSLARHLKKFRPTHVVTNDLLSREAAELLASCTPPPKHLVMPMAGELPGGSPRYGQEGDFARCGWFLDWLGREDATSAQRYLVERAVPDYGAVLANEAARAAKAQITVASGVLCAYRRPLTGNPHFEGVDLGETNPLGCSFCTCATMPPVTSPQTSPLPLIEIQLRRILKTAGKTGRNKGRYEFFDIRAFWRFDELFKLVLRLKMPPSVFLFNPRIDDVLNQRARIERVLPALAKAGHEVRMLSMGIENFSESENARFNKRIRLEQVDEFLALTKKWGSSYPGVFRPFKAGNSPAELGFILFTPWTTLADLRVNLEAAAARGFPACGYWLYSILLIEAKAPLFLLAQKDGGILTDKFPDPGQYYGLFKNEGELSEVRAWRFKDAKVAELFALLVRVCAAEREGKACSHFRGDPVFSLAESLYREANAPPDGSVTPLKIALALLDMMAAARPPFSREALLREAVARASARPAAPAPTSPLSARGKAVARVINLLSATRPKMFAGLEFESVSEVVVSGERALRLAVSAPDRKMVVDLLDSSSKKPGFLRSRRFTAACHEDSPLPLPRERRQLAQFLRLIDASADKAAKTKR